MKIPKKKELLQLQKKYRTDKKIGEVYGVPARLVAYWRSKKKIGPYSFPKYSEDKIMDIWERFGDDARAGTELGISKAGFRQWRRKYDIIDKPIQLRLEQLELPLTDISKKKNSRKETIVQRILARKAGLKRADVGQFIEIEPDLAISNNNAIDVINQMASLGTDRIWDPSKIAIVLDHRTTSESNGSIHKYKTAREFAKKHRIRNFFDLGEGMCHHLVLEQGLVLPGHTILGTETYATTYGCIGAFSAKIDVLEMAALWATGRIWLRVPETMKIVLKGHLNRGVFAKDIILNLIRDIPVSDVDYRAIEFSGPAIQAMSMADRSILTSMASEMKAKSAIISIDEMASRYMKKITKMKFWPITPDPDAAYSHEIEFDISYLTPQIACHAGANNTRPIEEMVGKKIDQVILGSCINGKIEDLEIAAGILKGRKINRELRMTIVPGSRKTYLEALEKGLIKIFVESGCAVAYPGLDSYSGVDDSILSSGDKIMTTTGYQTDIENDNVNSEIFIASPATTAASALEGIIADPRKYIK